MVQGIDSDYEGEDTMKQNKWKEDYRLYRILAKGLNDCANLHMNNNLDDIMERKKSSICKAYRESIGELQSKWPQIFKPDCGDHLAWRSWYKNLTGSAIDSQTGRPMVCNQSTCVYNSKGELVR
jgi:hypothetical protein